MALTASRAHLRRVRFKDERERAAEAQRRMLDEREEAEAELRSLRHGLQATSASSGFRGVRKRGLTLDSHGSNW